MIFAFIDHRDLVDRNIRDLVVLVTQIQHAAFYIDHISAKRGVSAARHVDLLAQ